MANKLYNEDSIRAIANAIRSKNGTENTYNVSEMAEAIQAIVTGGGEGGITPTGSIEITSNGTHDVTNYASAIVNVLTGGSEGEPMTFGSFRVGIYTPEETIGFSSLPNTKPNTSLVIEHGLGVVPDVAFLLNITPADTLVAPALILSGKTPTCDLAVCYRTADLAFTTVVSSEGKYCIADETTATFGGNGTSTYVMNPGQTYMWIVASEEYSDGSGAPTGSIEITENGTYNVAQYASATVAVPETGGITPSGTLTITSNQSYDVTNYATAVVNVPTEGVSIGPWYTGTFQVPDINNKGYQDGGIWLTVTHGLGFTPTKIMIIADEYQDATTFSGKNIFLGACKLSKTTVLLRKTDNTEGYMSTDQITNITDTTFDFGGLPTAYLYPCTWTYRWFAMA